VISFIIDGAVAAVIFFVAVSAIIILGIWWTHKY